MKSTRWISVRGESGFALIATLMVMVAIGALIAASFGASLTSIRTSNSDYHNSKAFYAAEAGIETGLSAVDLALQDGFLSDDELATITPPAIEGFTFNQYMVEKDGTWDTVTITDGPFAGLYAITQDIRLISKATHASGSHSKVVTNAQAQAIPIFQFAGFSNGAMEAYSGSRVDSYGRWHVNGDIYMATSDTHFHDYLTTPGKFILDGRLSHKDDSDINFYMEDASGNDVLVTFDSENTEDPDQFKNKSDLQLNGRLRAMGMADSLKLPLPPGLSSRELIRPRQVPGEPPDTEAEMVVKFSWQADMYVTVDLGDIQNRSSVCGSLPSGAPKWPNITITRDPGMPVPSDIDKCRIFQFDWEAFYDHKEETWVDVVDFDAGELRTWVLADSAARAPRIIYVEIKDAPVSQASFTDKSGEGDYFPALRTKNAARLHGPLTLGTEYPLYTWGDYNNIDKQPAALFADYVTALSNQWSDPSGSSPQPNKKCCATSQFDLMASFITGEAEGFVGCYHHGPDPGCTPIPSGWDINVSINHLEDLRGCSGEPADKCLFRRIGSFVTLWAPVHATAMAPSLNSTYKSPQRDWSFDYDLMDPAKLPPGTPNVGYVLRTSFREAY